ncbi:MAG: signal recognition particle protein, partial [Terriglobus sp.]
TKKERIDHEIINGSRRRRIAEGSGTSVQEVNQLLKQYGQMRKMFKGLGSGGGKMQRRLMSQMGQMGRMGGGGFGR